MIHQFGIGLDNFHINTKAVFKGCKTPKRQPDYVSLNKYGNSVSSSYWYGRDNEGWYVIRQSDHWVNLKKFNSNKIQTQCLRIGTCNWSLKTNIPLEGYMSGKCYLQHFKTNQ